MRIVCLSDTHSMHFAVEPVPDGDTLVFAGDFIGQNKNQNEQALDFIEWFSSFPHKNKVMIAGNHDWIMEGHYSWSMSTLMAKRGIVYLQDAHTNLGGLTFYGSPWQPEYHQWAFNLPRGKPLRKVWARIKNDTNVLITHCPPAGILDVTRREGMGVGCADLRRRVGQLRNLKLHVFGHIHEGYGHVAVDGVNFVNASLWEFRDFQNIIKAPIVVDI